MVLLAAFDQILHFVCRLLGTLLVDRLQSRVANPPPDVAVLPPGLHLDI